MSWHRGDAGDENDGCEDITLNKEEAKYASYIDQNCGNEEGVFLACSYNPATDECSCPSEQVWMPTGQPAEFLYCDDCR